MDQLKIIKTKKDRTIRDIDDTAYKNFKTLVAMHDLTGAQMFEKLVNECISKNRDKTKKLS